MLGVNFCKHLQCFERNRKFISKFGRYNFLNYNIGPSLTKIVWMTLFAVSQSIDIFNL
jgi:hypothetical protein